MSATETYEVHEGTVRGDSAPCRVYGDRRSAERAADDMAMAGRPASVYEVSGGDSRRVYAVSL